ncbi:MAG: ketoacyl-ACP synthase III [Acuticoccus sp.]
MQRRVDFDRSEEDRATPEGSQSPAEQARDDARAAPRTRVAGVGGALPERVVTNHDLATMVDTSDEWIAGRTGIKERHIAADGEFTSHLAERAARAALADAGLEPADIDLVVVATATPDHTFPATAVIVQERLGIRHGAAFDLAAACSGFVFALSTVDAMIAAGSARRALVIGAETFSRILDWEDRTTCVLFGDGAGAVVLEAIDGAGDSTGRGVIAHAMRSDGAHLEKLYVDGGPSTSKSSGVIRMRGQEVFRFAIQATVDVVEEVFARAGMTAADIDWFVPHQANQRIIDASARKLGIAPEKVVLTVAQHGNTSAASIPLALSVAAADGRLKKGDLVLLESLGGGFTWGAIILRW